MANEPTQEEADEKFVRWMDDQLKIIGAQPAPPTEARNQQGLSVYRIRAEEARKKKENQ